VTFSHCLFFKSEKCLQSVIAQSFKCRSRICNAYFNMFSFNLSHRLVVHDYKKSIFLKPVVQVCKMYLVGLKNSEV